MLTEEYTKWLKSSFSDISYIGKASSKKYRHGGNDYKYAELFQTVKNAYSDRARNEPGFTADNQMLGLNATDPEASEILNILDTIAVENKKAHGKSEAARRDAGVGGSMSDELSKIREAPMRINGLDMIIFRRFRTVRHNTVRMLYYVDRKKEDGKERETLVCLGVISDNQGARSALADQMAEHAPLDIVRYYEDSGKWLSNKYNELQTVKDFDKYLAETKEDQWEEIKALKFKSLDSVMEAYIAHLTKHSVPALPWVLGNIDLYKITSSEYTDKNDKGKVSWVSGFKFMTRQGIVLDAKNYYLWALNQTQYFENIKRPKQFGDIYRIRKKPEGNVVDWKTNPILRAYFAKESESQRKCTSAFWYCVAHRLNTPSLCDMNHGGTLKNKMAMLVRQKTAEMWECPVDNTMFKLQGDLLSDDKNLVAGDGTIVRPYLDYLFVFYDEFLPSREMWNNFKTIIGSYEPIVSVKQMYVDRYPVTGDPVPMYMTKNSYIQFYDKGAVWRRLFIVKTDAHNTYRTELTDRDRELLDDEQTCNDAFATLMDMGKKAHDEIMAMGGMDAINDIFPDIGQVFNSYADDFDKDVKEFYASLFEGHDKPYVEFKTEEVVKRFCKFADEEDSNSLAQRLIPNLLNMHDKNKKARVRLEGGRGQTTKYRFHRICEEVISSENEKDAA